MNSGMRGRRQSSTTIASSVSGAATPEIPPTHSYLASAAPFPRHSEREYERQYEFMPSNHSAFTRLPALEDDDEVCSERANSCQWHRKTADSGYGPAGLQYPPARLSPLEALRARQRSLMERNSLAETDEEMSHEDEVTKRFHPRRSSLPVHPMAHGGPGRWDFKIRAMPFPNLPIGRVSPLTSDHEHGAVTAKFVKQKSHSAVGPLVNRASSGTPPDKAAGAAGDLQSQSPQKPENIGTDSEEGEKRKETVEGEGGEGGEGEERKVVESESEEEEEGEEGGGSEDREEVSDVQEVDSENGAKAVHPDNSRPTLPSLPTTQKSSATTSASTPNSLSRPKRTPQAKTRTPSVPMLPTSLMASDSTLTTLPECLGDYERTLHNARNYMKEFKALAESGSSDPESEPEPLTTQIKAVRIMEQISSAAKLPALIDHHLIRLHKDSKHTDLGFSLSDGFGEPGVYVKSINSGGLAELNGKLQPFDRIMKVHCNVQ